MDYPNSGSLWPPKVRKNEKSPNLTGSIKMEADLLRSLIDESKDGLVEISISAWTKEWQGRKYLSLKGSGPYKKDEQRIRDDDEDQIPF